jgi:conjugative transposon TraN protein
MTSAIKILSLGLLLTALNFAMAQSSNESPRIEITYNKTTSLVFSSVVKSVDRGSRDILAQKAKGVENIIQLKAARQGFAETNLTIITADGSIHEFDVAYSKEPKSLVIDFASIEETKRVLAKPIFQTSLTETDFEHYATSILNSKRSIRFMGQSRYKIRLMLYGIYIKDDIIFYHVRLENNSNIDYDIELFRFFVRDKQKVKRTASQEICIAPISTFGEATRIKAQSSTDLVYALEKFTIPDAKRLMIEMFEKNGGRNLSLSIKNKTIVNAKLIE